MLETQENQLTPATAQPTHEAHSWIEISTSAFEHNVALYRALIGPHKQLALVVKSNAYGHGMPEIAKLAQKNNHVDWLCVSHLQEAVHLRNIGITKPLLLLNPVRQSLEKVALYNLDIMLTDTDILPALNAIGKKQGKQINIHVKVDTGLSRFGFSSNQIKALIGIIKEYEYIQINGMYTHFGESNATDLNYTQQQQAQFNNVLNELQAADIKIPFVHTSNTAGITSLIDHEQINFVRLGAGAYGVWPSEQARTINWLPEKYAHLKPVLSWKTSLVHCKTVPANTFVGYNRTYQTSKETRIGVLPVGYFDGYDKRLSNKGMVYIHGQSAPIIGTIGMNATMIDITHVPSARIDDQVILLGNYPSITAADLAQQMGCFNARQVVTQINLYLPRFCVD